MEIRRYTKRDTGALVKLWRRPEVYSRSSDDFCNPEHIDRYICSILSSQNIYLIGSDPKSNSFLFIPMNGVHASIHVTMLSRVNDKHNLARAAVGWVFRNTPIKAVTAMIPADKGSKNTRLFAVACGMRFAGEFEKSFKRDGVLLDQRVYHATQQDFYNMEGKACHRQQLEQ